MPDNSTPLYTIGTAADLLQVHPRTLRLYEQAGLLRPARKNNRRFYTNNDLDWVRCIRHMIHRRGLNQEGLRRLLGKIPCWEIRGCSEEDRNACSWYTDREGPCWEAAAEASARDRRCHQCRSYVEARKYVCDRKDLATLVKAEEAAITAA
jgi:MerR family transcriptional regulator/heat shock protein HspR